MRTLVLNAGYEPLAIVSFKRALVLVLNDKATVIERVEEELFELKQASESLQTEIDRFDEEDWRDVVPDVVWANDELKSEIEDTEGELSKLSSNL